MTFKEVWNKGRERLNRKLIRAGLFLFILVAFLLLSIKV